MLRNNQRAGLGWRGLVATLVLSLGTASAASAQPLDVDGNGQVDVYTDIVFIARTLLGLSPVPASYRTPHPETPPDPTIAARVYELAGISTPPTPHATPTPVNTATATSTATTRISTVTQTPSRTISPTITLTPTRSPTRTLSPSVTVSPTPSPTVTLTPTASPTFRINEGADVVRGAAEVAAQNGEVGGVFDLWPVGETRTKRKAKAGLTAAALAAGVPAADACSFGGSATIGCVGNEQTITYDGCIDAAASGSSNQVTRNGVVRLTVERPVGQPPFCDDDVDVDPLHDTVTQSFVGYELVERNEAQTVVARLQTSNWTDRFAPSATPGCKPKGDGGAVVDGFGQAVDGAEGFQGSLAFTCHTGAQSLPCPRGSSDVTLTVLGSEPLTITRTSGGFPCELGKTLRGEVRVSNRAQNAFGEACQREFTQRFDDFFIGTTPDDAGNSAERQDGKLSVDALGDLLFETKIKIPPAPTPTPTPADSGERPAIAFDAGKNCPIGGNAQLSVRRPPLVVPGAPAPPAAALQRGVDDSGDLRQTLLRNANGQVFQVVENVDRYANFGADAMQITTLIGAEAGGVGQCAAAAGATIKPQAVAGVEPGKAFPTGAVRKALIVPYVGKVVLNKNFDNGNGRLCVGPDCSSPGAECPVGGACRVLTAAAFTPIEVASDDIPAAHLVPIPALGNPCNGFGEGEGNGNFLTYRFGATGPTVQIDQCAPLLPPGETSEPPAPNDGFRLANGSTAVFLYDTAFASLFNAALAGFPVDVNGANSIGCPNDGNRVLHLGDADLDSVKAPLIEFTEQDGQPRINYDFLGDGSVEGMDTDDGCVGLTDNGLSQCTP